MSYSIAEIAAALGAEAAGDTALRIVRPAEPQVAGPGDLAMAMSADYAEALITGRARAAVLWQGADWQAFGLEAAIFAPRARRAMSRLTGLLDPAPEVEGIHATAYVGRGAELGAGVTLGPFAVVGEGAHIGDGSWIGPHVSIAAGSRIGDACRLHAGVRIARNVRLGDRVWVQPNAVIGDGFSFVSAETSNAERARSTLGGAPVAPPEDPVWYRIHSLGGVEIGPDVEIGANSCVDAGTIRPTRVGDGTKIDNLVQIGHNVVIGRHCLLCAGAAVAGSARIGDRVVLAGLAGVSDNISLGDDVVAGAGSLILSDVPAGRVVMGAPAMPMAAHIESYKALRRLPRLLARLKLAQKPVPKSGRSD